MNYGTTTLDKWLAVAHGSLAGYLKQQGEVLPLKERLNMYEPIKITRLAGRALTSAVTIPTESSTVAGLVAYLEKKSGGYARICV